MRIAEIAAGKGIKLKIDDVEMNALLDIGSGVCTIRKDVCNTYLRNIIFNANGLHGI